MKGLLAGRITRDHVFAEGDSRPTYDIFRGEARRRTHDVLDELGEIAGLAGLTIAQLSIGWALSQTGVTAALVVRPMRRAGDRHRSGKTAWQGDRRRDRSSGGRSRADYLISSNSANSENSSPLTASTSAPPSRLPPSGLTFRLRLQLGIRVEFAHRLIVPQRVGRTEAARNFRFSSQEAIGTERITTSRKTTQKMK